VTCGKVDSVGEVQLLEDADPTSLPTNTPTKGKMSRCGWYVSPS
jgi:hypothetical protein